MRVPLAALVLAGSALLPDLARAAAVTEVADAFDGEDPFDFHLDVRYVRAQTRARITREFHDANGDANNPGRIIDSTELRYVSVKHSIDVTARFGLYKDLELSLGVPIVLGHAMTWNPAAASAGLIDTNDRVYNTSGEPRDFGACPGPMDPADGAEAPASPLWRHDPAANTCVPSAAAAAAGATTIPYAPLFASAGSAFLAGVGDPRVGLAWGLMNHERDETKPSWVLGFEYKLPIMDPSDPTAENSEAKPGAVGDGLHRFLFWTALSKRFGRADPYVKFHYTLSTPGPRAFNNCEAVATGAVLSAPQNCGQGVWTNAQTDPKPRHVGGVLFGSEIVPWEDAARGQKFALDGGLVAEFHSEGRDYSEASYMLRKLTYTEQFGRVGGQFGVSYHGGEHLRLGLGTGFSIDTAHMLTGEAIGKDSNGNDKVDLDEAHALDHELNPSFDFRYDVPGRRLRISQVYNFWFGATGSLLF